MPKRISDVEWRGDLKDGAGTLRLGGGAFEGRYSFKSRFEDGPAQTPRKASVGAQRLVPSGIQVLGIDVGVITPLSRRLHILHASGHGGLDCTQEDLLRCRHDRLRARAADAVYSHRRY